MRPHWCSGLLDWMWFSLHGQDLSAPRVNHLTHPQDFQVPIVPTCHLHCKYFAPKWIQLGCPSGPRRLPSSSLRAVCRVRQPHALPLRAKLSHTECTAYKLLSEARGMEKTYRFLLVRFKTEQFRLLDWATVAGLSPTELGNTGIINQTNRAIIIGILDELHRLLMRFGRLDERLRPLTNPLIIEDCTDSRPGRKEGSDNDLLAGEIEQRFPPANALLIRALAFVNATSKYPARLRWVFCDKTKTEEVLSRIAKLNNSLRDLLGLEQMRLLQRHEVTTQCQIVQLNTKMDHLLEIVQAGFEEHRSSPSPPLGPSAGDANPLTPLDELVQMAKFKALLSAAGSGGLNESLRSKFGIGHPGVLSSFSFPSSCALSEKDIVLESAAVSPQSPRLSPNRRHPGWYRPPHADFPGVKVWIESTSIEPDRYYDPDAGPDRKTLRRFEALVTLLRETQQTSQFRALPCLGYYLQTTLPPDARSRSIRLRYGLVFCLPPGIDSRADIVSLRQLLDHGRDSSFNSVPSLSERLGLMRTLAQSVERLHAVGWLHKALSSDNVLFFSHVDTGTDIDFSQPYLSGFDYSRPADTGSMSEAPVNPSLLDDIYRHPSVQGQDPTDGSTEHEGFNRHHDIYSLGIIMLEIAEWRPIEDITRRCGRDSQMSFTFEPEGNPGKRSLSAADVLNTRSTLLRLLEPPERSRLAAFVGVSIARAIWSCIEGQQTFGAGDEGLGEDGIVGAKIQARFFTAIIKPLFSVHIS